MLRTFYALGLVFVFGLILTGMGSEISTPVDLRIANDEGPLWAILLFFAFVLGGLVFSFWTVVHEEMIIIRALTGVALISFCYFVVQEFYTYTWYRALHCAIHCVLGAYLIAPLVRELRR